MIQTLAWGLPGGSEWVIILLVALLIFGRRLPDVGRSLGKGIVEFKKGLKGVKSELDDINDEVDEAVRKEDREQVKKAEEPRKLESAEEGPKEKSADVVSERDKVET